ETKNAARLLIEGNVFENNCLDSQDGFAIVLKSANQSGGCNWCVTEDVTFRWNRIINSPGGFNLASFQAEQGGTAIPMRRVHIAQVEMRNVGAPLAGNRRHFQMLGALSDLEVLHVTALSGANQMLFLESSETTRLHGLTFSDNLFA